MRTDPTTAILARVNLAELALSIGNTAFAEEIRSELASSDALGSDFGAQIVADLIAKTPRMPKRRSLGERPQ